MSEGKVVRESFQFEHVNPPVIYVLLYIEYHIMCNSCTLPSIVATLGNGCEPCLFLGEFNGAINTSKYSVAGGQICTGISFWILKRITRHHALE